MNTERQTDIQRLKQLLERFYAGETSPQEETEISRLLDTTAKNDTAFDADRALFSALSEEKADLTRIDAPEGLGEKLGKLTARHFAAEKIRSMPRFLRWAAYSATAACAACMIWVVTETTPDDATLAHKAPAIPDSTITVHAPATLHTDTLSSYASAQTLVAPIPDKESEKDTQIKPMRKKADKPRIRTTVQEDNTVVIDNSEEGGIAIYEMSAESAAKVSEAVLLSLGRTLAAADMVVSDTGNKIDPRVSAKLSKMLAPQEKG